MLFRSTDYKDSLRQRVALLKGVSVASMDEVYRERLKLNPGAAELVHACKKAGLKTLLVSGGFTFFTDRIRDELGMDYTRSNELGVDNGFLTGEMVDQPWGDICDGDEKRTMVLQTCALLGITPAQVIAVGDGANDLPMMRRAAKPADCRWPFGPSRRCGRRRWWPLMKAGWTDCLN